VAVEEERVVTAERTINLGTEKRLTWFKGEGMGGCVVQGPTVHPVLNPIKLLVRVAEKRWWSKSHPHRTRNYYAWTVLRNKIPPPLETRGGFEISCIKK